MKACIVPIVAVASLTEAKREFGVFGIMVILFAAIVFYFLPTVVAAWREHHNSNAIFVLNLLLGWTFLGWVIALVWAFTSKPQQKPGPFSPT